MTDTYFGSLEEQPESLVTEQADVVVEIGPGQERQTSVADSAKRGHRGTTVLGSRLADEKDELRRKGAREGSKESDGRARSGVE